MKLAAAVALCALVTMATGFGYYDDYGYGGYPGNLYSSYSYLPYRNIGFGSYGSHGNAYGFRGHSYGLYGDSYSPYGNSYGRSRPSYNKYGFGYGLSLRRTPYNARSKCTSFSSFPFFVLFLFCFLCVFFPLFNLSCSVGLFSSILCFSLIYTTRLQTKLKVCIRAPCLMFFLFAKGRRGRCF